MLPNVKIFILSWKKCRRHLKIFFAIITRWVFISFNFSFTFYMRKQRQQRRTIQMNSLRNYNCVTSLGLIGEPLRLSYFKDGFKEVEKARKETFNRGKRSKLETKTEKVEKHKINKKVEETSQPWMNGWDGERERKNLNLIYFAFRFFAEISERKIILLSFREDHFEK